MTFGCAVEIAAGFPSLFRPSEIVSFLRPPSRRVAASPSPKSVPVAVTEAERIERVLPPLPAEED